MDSLNNFIFKIPFNNCDDIFNTIETMLDELNNTHMTHMTNISNNSCNNDIIQFDIQFDIIDPYDHLYDEEYDEYNFDNNLVFMEGNNDEEDDEINYFKTCHEINNKLCKSEKIKKNDPILSEQCFICIDNYKENELKRTLPCCKHCFHKKCIDKWIKKNPSCPICRDNLIKNKN